MTDKFRLSFGFHSIIAAAMLMVATTTGAVAQIVVVFVNGEPITKIDVEHRMKLIQITTQKAAARAEVIDDLIDEKLKVREAKRWSIEITDSDVDNIYKGMAGRMRTTAEQLTQNLARQGTSAASLKARIRADSAWQQLVRGRFRERLQLNEKDIQNALEAGKSEEQDTVAYDYVMRPILFLVPPGSPAATYEARRRDAEALRSRFKSCEEGIGIARTFRDVAVRSQVTRSSGDLPEPLRKMLASVPVGQLTAPEVTKLGVEVFAICSKHQSKSDTAGKRQARDAIFAKRFERESARYLKRLRGEALIERVQDR